MRRLIKGIYFKICGLCMILCLFSHVLPAAAHEHGGDSATEIQMGPSELTMNTSIASLIFVLLVVVVLIFHLRSKSTLLSKMTGMMAAMTIAMVSSLLVGTIAGIVMEKLFLSTVIGVTFGMIIGYVSGKSLHLLASLDGMLAGLMGGMMGAMLGVMVISDFPTLSIIFMDIVLAVSMLVLYRLLDTEEILTG
ncbi:hypothetical protein [Paenibacillus sp. N3.4]|uniref:hypothetical protein n=1 Tax=Paenibacillus sp. N3.4 TaxID=2603222 RepID=UPI0011CA23DE|nr:hypothetical protein [Paenibacillus sp. N3.4]TXK76137.1 hypothetical protein FU659_26060 [Paenibacillus sp. N3.4]